MGLMYCMVKSKLFLCDNRAQLSFLCEDNVTTAELKKAIPLWRDGNLVVKGLSFSFKQLLLKLELNRT